MKSQHDVVVIGSGISGASLAHACAQAGLSVLVVEKSGAPGGCIRSHRLDGGYWFELGAHTCYNSYRGLLGLLEEKSALDKIVPRAKVPFRLYSGGRTHSIVSELSILSLLAHAPSVAFTKKEGRTVRGYYERLVGKGNYDRIFGPMFAAVPSQKADEFPSDMLFKKRERRKELPRSFTLSGGLQTIVDVLLEDPRITTALSAEAKAVEREGEGFRIRFADGSERTARFLALAAPPSVGAQILRGAFPAVADELAKIKVTPVSTTAVVVSKDSTKIEPLAFLIPLDDDRFYSAVSRDTVPDPTYRAFAFHFKPGISEEQRQALAAEVLKVDRGALQHVVQRSVELPSPRMGHRDIVAALDKALAGTPLFLTGNYFDGLSIEDCVSRSRVESERLLKAAGAAVAPS
ncbi:MAG TPA: FAD-dependent oxidoreductase [Myxococcales bacterium]|jgi:protoporphyrinogen oxidase